MASCRGSRESGPTRLERSGGRAHDGKDGPVLSAAAVRSDPWHALARNSAAPIVLGRAAMKMQIALVLLLASLSVACGPEDTNSADAHVDDDAGPPDSGSFAEPDGGGTCDCCGTTVGTAGGESCLGGICDPWCGLVAPCDATCDQATSVCVYTFGGADAGAPDGGSAGGATTECVPRPTECEHIANCGGPDPDPSCDLSDPCFEALDCVPQRVVHSGWFVQCSGA